MVENENLNLLMDKLLSDEGKIKEISELDDLQEIYKCCLDIHGGYTYEEFNQYFAVLVEEFFNEISSGNLVGDDDLNNITGGSSNARRKAIATTLSVLSALWMVPSVYGSETSDTVQPRRLQQIVPKEKPTSFGEKIKQGFGNFLDWVHDHKVGVTLGSLFVGALGGAAMYFKDDIATRRGKAVQLEKDKKEQIELLNELGKQIDRVGDMDALCSEYTKSQTVDGLNDKTPLTRTTAGTYNDAWDAQHNILKQMTDDETGVLEKNIKEAIDKKIESDNEESLKHKIETMWSSKFKLESGNFIYKKEKEKIEKDAKAELDRDKLDPEKRLKALNDLVSAGKITEDNALDYRFGLLVRNNDAKGIRSFLDSDEGKDERFKNYLALVGIRNNWQSEFNEKVKRAGTDKDGYVNASDYLEGYESLRGNEKFRRVDGSKGRSMMGVVPQEFSGDFSAKLEKIGEEIAKSKNKQKTIEERMSKPSSTTDTLAKLAAAGVGLKGVWDVGSKLISQGTGFIHGTKKLGNDLKEMYWNAQYLGILSEDLMTKLASKAAWMEEGFDNRKVLAELSAELDRKVKGQEEALKTVKDFASSVYTARTKVQKGISEIKGAFALYLNGPSGTGKTFTASMLAKYLTPGVKPFTITPADVGMAGTDPVRALLQSGDKNSEEKDMCSFIHYVQTHRGNGLVFFDEYDKVAGKDGKNPFDEFFRQAIDNGYYKDPRTQQVVDLAGICFVFGSNETRESLQGRIRYIPASPFGGKGTFMCVDGLDEEGNETYIAPTKGDPSETFVCHDTSFVQRLAGKIAYFARLPQEAYTEMAKRYLGDNYRDVSTIKQLSEMDDSDKGVILVERVLHGFHSCEISEEDYKKIGEFASKSPSSARAIVGTGDGDTGSVAGNLRSAINDKISSMIANEEEYKNAKFVAKAIFDEKDSTGKDVVRFKVDFVGYAD